MPEGYIGESDVGFGETHLNHFKENTNALLKLANALNNKNEVAITPNAPSRGF